MRLDRRVLPVLFLVAPFLAACSSIAHRADVETAVDRVDRDELRETLFALHFIGPRPVSDAAATARAVDFLKGRLSAYGYDVVEEHFEVRFDQRMVARVRPGDDPGADVTEIEVEPDLLTAGSHARRHRSALLAAEGWDVLGYSIEFATTTTVLDVPNLLATKRGSLRPEEVIELGAHYDTVPGCPGANDNGSGVAALMEVARLLATRDVDRSVRFCFFGAEEVGIQGSAAHVRNLVERSDSTVIAMVNLDPVGIAKSGKGTQRQIKGLNWFLRALIGFPDEADFIVVAGKSSSAWLGALFEDAMDTYTPDLHYYGANRIGHRFQDAMRSDHRHYWEAGIPALWVTDTGEYRTDSYHSPFDTPDRINFEFLTQVTRATLAAVLHLARR